MMSVGVGRRRVRGGDVARSSHSPRHGPVQPAIHELFVVTAGQAARQ